MAKIEIWKNDKKEKTIWDIAPKVVDEEIHLTFGEYPEKYVVIIPKNEIEDYYKKLFEGIAEKIS
jgi:hypothetical protein